MALTPSLYDPNMTRFRNRLAAQGIPDNIMSAGGMRQGAKIDPRDYETEEEYEKAVREEQAREDAFFRGVFNKPGLAPSGYGPFQAGTITRPPVRTSGTRWNENVNR